MYEIVCEHPELSGNLHESRLSFKHRMHAYYDFMYIRFYCNYVLLCFFRLTLLMRFDVLTQLITYERAQQTLIMKQKARGRRGRSNDVIISCGS